MNVSKNISQRRRDDAISAIQINQEKKAIVQNPSDDTMSVQSIQVHDDDSKYNITKFKTKVVSIPFKPSQVTKVKLKPAQLNLPKKKAGKKRSVSPKTPSCTKLNSLEKFEDIEATLAKITSSQRTICIMIDSFM